MHCNEGYSNLPKSHILHHKVVMVLHTLIISESYKCSRSSTNQANQSSHYEKYDGATCPSYYLKLKLKYKLLFPVSFVSRYIAARIKSYLKSTFLIQVATMKNTDYFCYAKEATTKSTLFTVSKDEQNTKEDTGKSMKNALHVLRYAKRYLSG